MSHLNTSNVKVQLTKPPYFFPKQGYLNTSNVKVQLL